MLSCCAIFFFDLFCIPQTLNELLQQFPCIFETMMLHWNVFEFLFGKNGKVCRSLEMGSLEMLQQDQNIYAATWREISQMFNDKPKKAAWWNCEVNNEVHIFLIKQWFEMIMMLKGLKKVVLIMKFFFFFFGLFFLFCQFNIGMFISDLSFDLFFQISKRGNMLFQFWGIFINLFEPNILSFL